MLWFIVFLIVSGCFIVNLKCSSFPRNIERHKFLLVEYFLSVSYLSNYQICNPVVFTVTCNGFCTELFKSASHANSPESKNQSCSESCSLHLYIVNGTFYTNCPVLRGQMNVSFRKADSLLFSSWCVGQAPAVLELEQKDHSRRAAKGLRACPPVASLVSEEALNENHHSLPAL